jgi:hypothetical protein
MANFIRSAKSGSDWTKNELLAYNIRTVPKSDTGFFGEVPEKLPENLSKEFLEYEFGEEKPEKDEELLMYLDLASRGLENVVHDSVSQLLRASGYRKKGRIVITGETMNLVVCGEYRTARTDVSILGPEGSTILLVQEDRRRTNFKDAESQVIAGAIAAFQYNNRTRRERGLNEIDSMIIPCITVKGTFPTFYLVPVTEELNTCIMGGIYPNSATEILRYIPRVSGRGIDVMKSKEDRKRVLQCYESFKKFVDNLEDLLKKK